MAKEFRVPTVSHKHRDPPVLQKYVNQKDHFNQLQLIADVARSPTEGNKDTSTPSHSKGLMPSINYKKRQI